MALQDLTPQLRTRLSRLERVVGWFVTIAILLLLFGLGYYVYQLAERKGWFLTKMPYFTFVRDATGLRVGDRVKLMGFDVGEIVEITAQPPEDQYFNVYVRFRVNYPYYGYLWEDSQARVGSADFLGNRFIEVLKGTNGAPTYAMHAVREVPVPEALSLVGGTNRFGFGQEVHEPGKTNILAHVGDPLSTEILQRLQARQAQTIVIINLNVSAAEHPEWVWDDKAGRYRPISKEHKGYWLEANESPALTERLEKVVDTVEAALPDFLALTNKLVGVLTNAQSIVSHADDLLVTAKPILTNFAHISSQLKGPGALGEWLLPTNVNQQLQSTLSSANSTLTAAQTNLTAISSNVLVSLENVANLTSNLSAQVQANGLVLTEISDLIVHTDEVVQGLKRFWLFKSTFGGTTNQPIESIVKPRMGGQK